MSGAEDRWASIPRPKGGFSSNEAEARWLEDTLTLRLQEGLASIGIKTSPKLIGFYDLLMVSLNAATTRGRAALRETTR